MKGVVLSLQCWPEYASSSTKHSHLTCHYKEGYSSVRFSTTTIKLDLDLPPEQRFSPYMASTYLCGKDTEILPIWGTDDAVNIVYFL